MPSRLKSTNRMSNTGYHANGKPNWWARIGSGNDAKFIEIPRVRGDEYLDCVVDLPAGTTVFIGAGKGTHKTVREKLVTEMIDNETIFAVIDTDGTRIVVWGIGYTIEDARENAGRNDEYDRTNWGRIVVISPERMKRIESGDVSADDLYALTQECADSE